MIDVERLRADTPGCDNVLHFNHAGASLPPAPVTEAVIDHLRLEEDIGGYEASELNAGLLEATYDAIARLVGGRPDEVALLENATRAWDMAAYGLGLGPGDRVLTGTAEYVSNMIAFLHQAKRNGVVVDVVPDDADGQLDVDALDAMIDGRTRLIAVTHCPTYNGLVNPAAEVGRVARDHGITYLLDACQSAGQLPLDVGELGCDLLSATGRKFLRGPRGTGFLWVRRELLGRLDPPFLDLQAATWTGPDTYELRDDARRFETWESYVAGRIGLGVAVDYALAVGLAEIAARVDAVATRLRAALADVEGVTVHDRGSTRSGIVTFSTGRTAATAVKAALRARKINVSTSSAEVARLDPMWDSVEAVVRASVHYLTTDDEIGQLVTAVGELA